nr:6-bladed beta-propeller [uncultured Draconibacterium sp.]
MLILLSCNKTEENWANIVLSFDLDKQIEKEIPFEKVFDEVQLVPLETSKESMIHEITKFEIYNERIYVLDARQRSLFIFDLNGRYIRKIKSIGKGPEEYTEIADININKYNKNIELLTPTRNMLFYDLNGSFIKKDNLNLGNKVVHQFANVSEDIICFYSFFSKKKLTIYSRSLDKILYEAIESPSSDIDGTVLQSPSSPFIESGEITYFMDGLNREIFKPTKDELVKVKIFDFGNYNLNLKYLKEIKGGFREKHQKIKELSSTSVVAFSSYRENENFIVTSFAFQNTFVNLIINKITKAEILFNEFENQIAFPSLNVKLYNDTVVTTVEPSYLEHYIPDLNSKIKGNITSIEDLEINDNPVLVKYKFTNNEK